MTGDRLTLAVFLAAFPFLCTGASAELRHAGTPWSGVVLLAGERVSTGPSPLPEQVFSTYQAQEKTRLFSLFGSVAHAFIAPPVGCAAFAQTLYTVVVSRRDPGPGPWPDRAAFFSALGTGYKRIANVIEKLTTQVGQLSSQTTPVSVNLAFAPVTIPDRWYLSLETSFTNSGVGACQVNGTYDFESQLMASTDLQMNKVR
jgi:hypothetical protein